MMQVDESLGLFHEQSTYVGYKSYVQITCLGSNRDLSHLTKLSE